MIARPASRQRRNPVKPQTTKIKFIDKYIDHPNPVRVTDPDYQPSRKH